MADLGGATWVLTLIVAVVVVFALWGVLRGSTSSAVKQASPWYVPSVYGATIFIIIAAAMGFFAFRSLKPGPGGGVGGLKTAFESLFVWVRGVLTSPWFLTIVATVVLIIAAIFVVYPSLLEPRYAQTRWEGPFPLTSLTTVAPDYAMVRSQANVASTYSCYVYMDPSYVLSDMTRDKTLLPLMQRTGMWSLGAYASAGQVVLSVVPAVLGAPPVVAIVDSVPVQRWVHFVVVFENDTVRLFMDGKLATAMTSGSLPANNFAPLQVGSADTYHTASGCVRYIGYWDHALSTDEISTVYSRTRLTLGSPSPPCGNNNTILDSLRNYSVTACVGQYC